MSNLTLTGLYIYPIKSLGGIALKKATVTPRGLLYDRRWMLTTPDGEMITQREVPRMATLTVEIKDEWLWISAPGQENLPIPLTPVSQRSLPVKIWDDTVMAEPVEPRCDQWFSAYLGTACRLVYFPDDATRLADRRYARRPGDQVGFADGFPFLLISEGSLADLNARLAQPVPMNRFRPNLVVSGCGAFDEDSWRQIRIDGLNFDVVKPCARCSLTTIDQRSGIPGKEPLTTLATYRKFNGKVMFGQNVLAATIGKLSVGAPFHILAS